ncbi:MAG: PLP-dependent aminotransferase family protein [candidate division NC10 bacterium]|nr:PLP-dependent aminotransferase family protein [candidate division NC10 bacterium]
MVDVSVDKKSSVPVYQQISRYYRDMISQGKIAEGYRLPPERTLAKTLGVNRTTILNAYRDLKEAGLVAGHVGRGTTVLPPSAAPESAAGEVQPLRWTQLLRQQTATPWEGIIRDLHALTERKDSIILAIGLPAHDLIPAKLMRETLDALVAERGPEAFSSGPCEGVFGFRAALAGLMGQRGAPCDPDEILVTTGSQQAIDLIARVFLEPGDVVVVEEPSYFGALNVFRQAQARLLGVPVDRNGMRVDLLEPLLQRHRPKFIYTLPTYQNPSGALLSLERRRRLLELAYRFRVPVVEDDIYQDFSYDGDPPPTLKALDTAGFVIYVSSFSKTLSPGLRIGWVAAARPLLHQLVLAKQLSDLHSPTLSQLLIERLLISGDFRRHVGGLREAYARRRETMGAALRAEAPEGVSWTKPAGGFYFWCRLPDVSQAALMARAGEEQVSYLPGMPCFVHERSEHRVRLSYSHCPADQIHEGVARLMRAVRRLPRVSDPTRGRLAETRALV